MGARNCPHGQQGDQNMSENTTQSRTFLRRKGQEKAAEGAFGDGMSGNMAGDREGLDMFGAWEGTEKGSRVVFGRVP